MDKIQRLETTYMAGLGGKLDSMYSRRRSDLNLLQVVLQFVTIQEFLDSGVI